MVNGDDDPIERRLDRIKGTQPVRRKGVNPWLVGGLAASGGLLLGGYIVAVAPSGVEKSVPLETSTPAEFGGGDGLDGFSIAKTAAPLPDVPKKSAEVERLTKLVNDLTAEIAALKRSPAAGTDDAALTELKRRNEELERAAQAAQSELDAERALTAQQGVAAQAEAARTAELQRRREEAETRRQAQINSDMVAFRGGESSKGMSAGDMAGASEDGDQFLRASAVPVEVKQAETIANPSNTITQGTLIEATLETAINSDLPGHISAVVSYDVWSWDMSRVLIPRGSKLFGRYESDVGIGQKRILVAWTRILTTDGQSVEIAAYGSDRLGRSGLPAKVRAHFLQKFGSATLLSIIGAAPDYAAAQSDKNASADAIKAVGGGLESATDGAIGDYLSIPPTLSTDQGAVVMIRVDSDLEFF